MREWFSVLCCFSLLPPGVSALSSSLQNTRERFRNLSVSPQYCRPSFAAYNPASSSRPTFVTERLSKAGFVDDSFWCEDPVFFPIFPGNPTGKCEKEVLERELAAMLSATWVTCTCRTPPPPPRTI
ncbi:hypothetical protein CEXT_57001 [Caerostris extrusa]|uniref:Uncharacterized protein n=1 Tax=Caerostris extrusa TaxID=172846 RepID=A0AAV4RC36_CAEEX|nr:hypothetical protein CEXT_57001 [Caerostris extrusa]